MATPPQFPDLSRATRRVLPHLLMSIPFAAAAIIAPPVGRAYIRWRTRAESADQTAGRDSPLKAQVDLYSQTWLVNSALRFWHLFS